MWEEWECNGLDHAMMRPKGAWRPSAAADLIGDILINLFILKIEM
jgi:hypothetical protein